MRMNLMRNEEVAKNVIIDLVILINKFEATQAIKSRDKANPKKFANVIATTLRNS